MVLTAVLFPVLCFEKIQRPICCWLRSRRTSNSGMAVAWLTASQKPWHRVISQWVKIGTKSYWLTGENRDGGQWTRLWDLAVVINTGVLPEGASDSVFIQSDAEQRSTIVQLRWCCQSTRGSTAGGCSHEHSLTHTHTLIQTHTHRAVVIGSLFASKSAFMESYLLAFVMPFCSGDWCVLHLCLLPLMHSSRLRLQPLF